MIRFLHFHPITVAACLIFAVAAVKGGRAERWGCFAMVTEWLLEFLVDMSGTFHRIAIVPTLMLDVALASSLLALALRYGKLWLGAAMIIQSVVLALHAMELSDDSPGFYVYAASLNICTCLGIGSLLVGTLAAWRQRTARKVSAPRKFDALAT